MRTLLENITMVKGVEYFVVIAFCFGFIALWILVHADKGTQKKIVAWVIPLTLIFAGGAIALNKHFELDVVDNETSIITNMSFPEYYSNGTPATIISHNPEKWLNVNNSEYLAISYGPATKFHQVMSNKVSCKTCHHNSDEIHACKDCHERPFNPDNSTKPGLKAAYHQRCMFCHIEVFKGPDSCVFCHTKGAPELSEASIPKIPHQLTWENCIRCHKNGIPNGAQETKVVYHDSCLKCHEGNITGATKPPSDHAGRTGDTCQGCHKKTETT
jgi:hypothetical protein